MENDSFGMIGPKGGRGHGMWQVKHPRIVEGNTVK